ncbi:MAG: DUF6629 family protein [bacterium]|nr:DUF6629 family protein [bacterium]
MCFSASASFASSALLIPAGIYSIRKALHIKKEYLLIASFIFIFALQQAVEGLVWLSFRRGGPEDIQFFSKIFLSFSYLIWPVLSPLALTLIEPSYLKRRSLALYTFLGLIFGCSIYLPLLLYAGWLDVSIINYSIFYNTRFIYDPYISKVFMGLIYAAIIVGPMLIADNRHIRLFGLTVLVSGMVASFSFYHAFISVWCFFAGLLSLYIIYILRKVSMLRPAGTLIHFRLKLE